MATQDDSATPYAGGETELTARLGRLSLEQKVLLLTGADIWSLHPEPTIGLRRVVMSDGPAGVRGEQWDERYPSANVPSPTALAATWDEERLERIGRLLASEARSKNVDVLLAPTVNLHRTPYGGRHFECFSEDPLLTSRIGSAYVRGLQAGGVAATVKHFVANDSETDRFTVDTRVDERTLRELYLAPFEAIVRDAGAWAVMAAYNSVNGTTMTENALLREVLKEDWGFDGVVVSDWYAARSVAAAGDGLLDLVMPGPDGPWGDALVAAVRSDAIPESAVDDHLRRLLRLAARVGALDGIGPAVSTTPTWTDQEITAELRATAAAGFVLARNEGAVLPLDIGNLRRVAVLGPNGAVARTLGGGSATVTPTHVISPLEGLRAAFGGDVEVVHAEGVRAGERIPIASLDVLRLPDSDDPGAEVVFFDIGGEELGRQRRRAASMFWWGQIEEGLPVSQVDHLEIRTRLRVPEDGAYAIGASGLGVFQLSVDGTTVLDAAVELPPGADVVQGIMKPPQQTVSISLSAGRDVPVVLAYRPAAGAATLGAEEAVSMLTVQLNLAREQDEDVEFERAVALAADSDVTVVVVGTTEEVESEGFDRMSLALPGRQDELVARITAVNPRTIVVVNAGAPVLLPWADDVAAVLLAWFPGQEFGDALADVLLGRVEPGGRLPSTWPMSEVGHPSVTPVAGELPYSEGLFIGYRAYDRDGHSSRFPFGHGLGYTEWSYESIETPTSVRPGENVTLRVSIRNIGERAAREVVQVYVSRPDSAVERPVRWLAGFGSVELDPDEAASVDVILAARTFEHWDVAAGRWDTEPGTFQINVGSSSRNLKLSAEVVIAAGW